MEMEELRNAVAAMIAERRVALEQLQVQATSLDELLREAEGALDAVERDLLRRIDDAKTNTIVVRLDALADTVTKLIAQVADVAKRVDVVSEQVAAGGEDDT